jgi:hypothetical protein
MKTYLSHFQLSFGKHQGKRLDEIVIEDPNYLNWCIIHLRHFFIGNSTIEKLQNINPKFKISAEAEQQLDSKIEDAEERQYERDNSDWADERRTYDDYNGSYAQDQMGWSDQDINDVFGGDADAYWNID